MTGLGQSLDATQMGADGGVDVGGADRAAPSADGGEVEGGEDVAGPVGVSGLDDALGEGRCGGRLDPAVEDVGRGGRFDGGVALGGPARRRCRNGRSIMVPLASGPRAEIAFQHGEPHA